MCVGSFFFGGGGVETGAGVSGRTELGVRTEQLDLVSVRMSEIVRVATDEGGYADIPPSLRRGDPTSVVVVSATPRPGIAMTGEVLTRDGEWTILSCGGLLVRTRHPCDGVTTLYISKT